MISFDIVLRKSISSTSKIFAKLVPSVSNTLSSGASFEGINSPVFSLYFTFLTFLTYTFLIESIPHKDTSVNKEFSNNFKKFKDFILSFLASSISSVHNNLI